MLDYDTRSFTGDNSLAPGEDDRLGFDEIASQFSAAILAAGKGRSFVFGLEGKWGSGKSSLLSKVIDQLQAQDIADKPEIVKFEPWLVGNRDGLLAHLFTELNKAIVRIEKRQGVIVPGKAQKAKAASNALRKFASGVGEVGGLIEVAGEATGFLPAKWGGKAIASLTNLSKPDTPTLEELKDNLTETLSSLDSQFLVIIDDVDRLDPEEVLEVLRLIKSVASIPNVSYVLCYDREVLAEGIAKVAKIESGNNYLEKIIQLTIHVPIPEPFQLRNWFGDIVFKIFDIPVEDQGRVRSAIDFEGGRQLTTPRAVKKSLDSLRFYSTVLGPSDVDIADLVWLTLIKDGNPKLYRWIEEYCGTAAAQAIGVAKIGEQEIKSELSRFEDTVPEGHFSDLMYRHVFSEILPGVSIDYDEGSFGLNIFAQMRPHEINEAINFRRLASPDHFRYYFSLGKPSHSLAKADYETFSRNVSSSVSDVSALLVQWHHEEVANGLTKTDYLLERISSHLVHDLDSESAANLILAFGATMDELFSLRPISNFQYNSVWDRAERLLRGLLSSMAPELRGGTIATLADAGKSIGWITSILRRETFAHGRYGSQGRSESEWYLTDGELDDFSGRIVDRYRRLSLKEIFDLPRPITVLFAWAQAGDESGPKKLIQKHLATDLEFVWVLERLTNLVRVNGVEALALSKDNVGPFLDYGKALERLAKIVEAGDELSERAEKLLLASKEAF
ncbi:hypothetical protein A3718_12320 [Erythrobacter sp. HI0019]|uniref:KAP family P-loop NTPase fold protein n=1 Tax=unclassified Erythrobacter TaxID=2633097 RepID=UPI0007B90900|nr:MULTISPECIES: P-loop NTPase fold protein [unclassified Erythrobacter]KZX92208.1 hypothetical protein A3718_12320 [Erythrobacter sp. HI0019]KZY08745.1 hypothetical protein A3723_11970 [Erythrobacter sp. HI0028]